MFFFYKFTENNYICIEKRRRENWGFESKKDYMFVLADVTLFTTAGATASTSIDSNRNNIWNLRFGSWGFVNYYLLKFPMYTFNLS